MKKIIKLYQILFSPLLPNHCRFFPSCSEYYCLAIEKYGEIKGLCLFLKRIRKCHFLNKGGIDLP
ncbi:MAG: membrane protein insertion efficiency factor YidD [Candidatus Pacebacteria bacterium]|nr:membrane protein insertion efficiency factor YidD [Candidatus Paceibacterota bacterium]